MADIASIQLQSVSPILAVHDLPLALEFYQRSLGFDLAWSWGTPQEIAAVCRDSVEITLKHTDAQSFGPSRIYLGVSGIDAYYAQIQQAGVQIVVPIGDRSYGMRDFRIADPSGNELSIGQEVGGDSRLSV